MLPDRWIAELTWETGEGENRRTRRRRIAAENPVADPLLVAPDVERDGAIETPSESSASGDVDDGEDEEDGTDSAFPAWMTDFGTAEDVGMALRIPLDESAFPGFDPTRGFSSLAVFGVKASMRSDETLDAVTRHFDAHQYTDGFSFLPQGTPTNPDRAEAAELVESRFPTPFTNRARSSNGVDDPAIPTDGDRLAEVFGLLPTSDRTAGDEGPSGSDETDEAPASGSHPFEHVPHADGTEGTDAHHANSALWPATVGYSLMNILVPKSLTDGPLGEQDESEVRAHVQRFEELREHFVRYVRGRGPHSAIRVGRQPYGVLPTMSVLARDEPSDGRGSTPIRDGLVADLRNGVLTVDEAVFFEEVLMDQLVEEVPIETLLNAGASPGRLYRHGVSASDLVEAEVDAPTLLASRVPLVELTDIDGVELPALDPDDVSGLGGGPLDPRGTGSGISVGSGGFLGGPTSGDGPTAEDSEDREDATAEDEEPTKPVSEVITEYLGVFAGIWEDALAGSSTFGDRTSNAGDGSGTLTAQTLLEVLARTGRSRDIRLSTIFELGAEDGSLPDEFDELGIDPAVTDLTARPPDTITDMFGVSWVLDDWTRILDPSDLVDDDVGGFMELLVGLARDVDEEPNGVERLFSLVDVPDIPNGVVREEFESEDEEERREKVLRAFVDPAQREEYNGLWKFLRQRLLVSERSVRGNQEQTNQRARLDEYFAHRIELYEEYGDFGFPWSALRSFLLFGLLWEFLCARLRLGIRHDDLPQAGPEIARHESAKSIYDELFGDAPSSLTRSHPDLGGDTYAEALRKAAVTYDEHSIDPRLSEFVASLEYLAGKEPSELEDLFLETLDVSSHRLDAWWTSLATRRLDELRAWQGQQLPEPSAPPNWAGDPDDGSSASAEEGEEEPSSSTTSGGGNILVGGSIFTGNDEPLAVDLDDATAWWEPSDTPAVIDTGVLDILTGPPGLYVGAYGFVEDLSRDVPKDGNVATTPEFVHTPSPQQATTAALLRSAFEARDPERDGAPLAIDLSAERVRRARRIIDGVRQGQPLGELLGYRFERRLHERTVATGEGAVDLMQYKHAFRVKFPSVERAVLPDDPANLTQYEERAAQSAMSDVVDGYRLLRAWDSVRNWEETDWNGRGPEQEGGYRFLPLPDGVTPPDTAALTAISGIVAELRDSVDAVGDLLLAESVHQLGQGNFDRAGGSVAALARGEVFPEPTVVDTPRTETNVSHRQCVVLDPATEAGTEGTDGEVRPRAAAEPALNAWLEDLLVPFDRVGCRVEYRWTETTPAGEESETEGSETAVDRTQETAMTLDELGLCPLDFLALSGDGEAEQAELEQRLTYRFVRARPDGVPSDATLALSLRKFSPPATASVADLLEHARSLRALVLASRPLRADDLSHPSDGSEPGWDEETIADLERRGDKASTSLAEVAEALENRLELLDPPIPGADETTVEETDPSTATGEPTPEPSSERVPAWRTVVGGVDRPLRVAGRAEMLPQPVMAEWWRDRNLASVADRIGTYARSLDLGLTSESDPVPLTTQVDLLVTSARAFAEEASLEAVMSVLEELDSGAEPFGAFGALADAIRLTGDDPEPIDGPVVRPEAEQIITGRLGEPIAVLDEADGESDPDDDPGSGTPGSVGGALGGLGGPSGIGGLAGGWLGSPGDPSGSGGIRGGINVGGGGTGGAGTGRIRDPGLPNNFGVVLPGGGIDPVFDPEDYNLLRRQLVSEKPIDVSVWGTTGTDWFELAPEGQVTADADGEFSATFDFSTVEPGARFTVVARLKGDPEVLYSRHGRVGAADATAEGEDLVERLGDALRPLSVLLWLSKHGDAFDTDASGSAAALGEAVAAVDWATVRAEFGRMTAEDNAFSETDRTAVEALVGLESTDVEGLESVVEATVDPVERVGLRDALTVTGDSPAVDDLRTWYRQTGDAWKLRTRLHRVADDPGLLDVVTPGTPLEYAPASGAAVSGIGGSVAEHLERLLEAPAWLVRYLGETVDRPDGLMRDVLKWLYHPELVTDTDALADRVLALADGLDAQPVLYELFAPEPAGFPPEAGATADDGAGGGAEGTVTVGKAERRKRLQAVASELRALAGVIRASSAGGGGGSGSYVATWNDAVASGTEVFRTERRRIGAIRTGVQPDEAFRRGMLETVRTRLVRASAFGVYGSTPQSPSGGDPSDESALVEQTRAVRARIAARREGLVALDDQLETMDTNPSPERVEALVARLEAIFGDSFVALPSFVPTNGPELGASFRNRGLLPEGAELAPETFLHRIAQVRERPADFREAYSYAEALTGRLHRRLRVAQLPHREDDTWVGAGVEGVTPTPGTLSILAQFGSTPENPDENGDLDPFGAGSRVTGVFVDEWVEAVPAATETTGVALNYDDPGARPPQSILLAVPPEDGEWSLVDLGAVIDETRRFVSLRAVDVGDLRESGSGGGLVPALYLPFGSGPEETRRAPTYADPREWPRPTPAPSAEPNPGENEEDEEDEEDDQ